MKRGKILEQLWYAHASLRVTEWTLESEKLLTQLDEQEDALFANLTPEQREALETYKVGLNDLRVLFEKDAFMKGIHFATAYMAEALGQPDEV